MRVGTWLEVNPYNSIPTGHDEDEGRQITRRDADLPANLISSLLFAFILPGPQNARNGENRGNGTCISSTLRTCKQTSGRMALRGDDRMNDSTVISRFIVIRSANRDSWET